MANDIIFKKKAFGGYDKESVLSYVNSMLNEKTRLEKLTDEQTRKAAALSARVRDLEAKADETERLSASVASREQEIAELKSRVEQLQASLDAGEKELAALREQPSSEDYEALRTENDALRRECARNRELERQVGAAMLDARVRSDELIAEAKKKAEAATRTVYDSIGDTALKIDDLSAGIAEIARSFTKSVEEVELRIKVLTGNMSKTAQALLTSSSAASGSQPEAPLVEESAVQSAGVQPEPETAAPDPAAAEPKPETVAAASDAAAERQEDGESQAEADPAANSYGTDNGGSHFSTEAGTEFQFEIEPEKIDFSTYGDYNV